jgi:glycine/D-amino acid oxidase-like deaminating enzyme
MTLVFRAFTAAMMRAAQGQGVKLRDERITGLIRRADGSMVAGVEVDGGVIEADAVVVAMGPWSLLAARWMVLPAVFGQRSPSIVYDTGTEVPADALFLEYHEESGNVVAVEVFPRADGSTLITAFSDEVALPLDLAAAFMRQYFRSTLGSRHFQCGPACLKCAPEADISHAA